MKEPRSSPSLRSDPHPHGDIDSPTLVEHLQDMSLPLPIRGLGDVCFEPSVGFSIYVSYHPASTLDFAIAEGESRIAPTSTEASERVP